MVALVKENVPSDRLAGAASEGFREKLQAELGRRCRENPQYSLRAFAMDLGTDHSTLSQILRGKRRLTEETIRRLGGKLGLSDGEIRALCAHEKLTGGPAGAGPEIIEARRLSEYAAKVVSEWHHFAILELTHVEDFVPDIRWIARVLDLPQDEVVVAVNRLVYLKLLEMCGGEWIDLASNLLVGFDAFPQVVASKLLDRFRALRPDGGEHPRCPQDHSTATIAVNSEHLGEAIEKLSELRRRFLELLDADETRDEVYRLDIHFYPIVKPASERKTGNGEPGDALATGDD